MSFALQLPLGPSSHILPISLYILFYVRTSAYLRYTDTSIQIDSLLQNHRPSQVST